MIKNLIVCGDSFYATSQSKINGFDFTGTHWSELVSKKLNLNLINLAMRGCSNRAIAFQIHHASSIPNSIVIAGWAAANERVEFSKSYIEYPVRLEHFDYRFANQIHPLKDQLSKNSEQIVSAGIPSIPDPEIQSFFLKYFPTATLVLIDTWVVLASLRLLKTKNVPIIFVENRCGTLPQTETENILAFIDEQDLLRAKDLNLFENMYENPHSPLDCGYHTHPDEQKRIAEYLYLRLKIRIKDYENSISKN